MVLVNKVWQFLNTHKSERTITKHVTLICRNAYSALGFFLPLFLLWVVSSLLRFCPCTTSWTQRPRPPPAACLRTSSPSPSCTSSAARHALNNSPTWSSNPASVADGNKGQRWRKRWGRERGEQLQEQTTATSLRGQTFERMDPLFSYLSRLVRLFFSYMSQSLQHKMSDNFSWHTLQPSVSYRAL